MVPFVKKIKGNSMLENSASLFYCSHTNKYLKRNLYFKCVCLCVHTCIVFIYSKENVLKYTQFYGFLLC